MNRLTSSYQNYIKSEKWKIKCAAYFSRYGKVCAICGTRQNIKVHHMTYARLGNEALSDLKGLCHTHHLALHAAHRKAGRPDLLWFSLRFIDQQKKATRRA